MIKYITAFFVAFALIACEPREDGTPPPPQDQQPEMPAEQQPDQTQQPQDQTQQPQDQTQQTDPTAQISDISDNELDAYVEANVEAREEQVDPIANRDEMEEILEGKDIDYNRFNEIHNTVQQDPQLQQEIQQRIQDEHGEGFEDPQTEY